MAKKEEKKSLRERLEGRTPRSTQEPMTEGLLVDTFAPAPAPVQGKKEEEEHGN